jgi:hypothetical protein
MLVVHGCTRLVRCGCIFSSQLIKGLEIRVTPMLVLIHLLEAAEDTGFDLFLSTS